MKWGDKKTLKFIRLYQMHPCLWDTSMREYNFRTKRDEAWDVIMGKMNIPNFTRSVCKIKIKNIRSQYCHELKRIGLTMKAGGKIHKPTLSWFDAIDKFLRPVVVQRTSNFLSEKQPFLEQTVHSDKSDDDTKNITDDIGDETTLKTEEIDLCDVEPENLLEDRTTELCSPHPNVDTTCSRNSIRYELDTEGRTTEIECLNLLATTIKKLENSLEKNTTLSNSNEFDVFGQSVAAQLSNMPIEDALQLQMEIQQLITTRRISRLSRAQDNRR